MTVTTKKRQDKSFKMNVVSLFRSPAVEMALLVLSIIFIGWGSTSAAAHSLCNLVSLLETLNVFLLYRIFLVKIKKRFNVSEMVIAEPAF